MKTYKELIEAFDSNDVMSAFIPNTLRKFRKTTRALDRMYPGVTQFLTVANRWVLKAKRFENRDLKKLLSRMKRRPDISDMNKADVKKIYNFIEKYNLKDIESVRHVFANYSDFTKREKTEY